MSLSRAEYERIRDAMISEGLSVEETSEPTDMGSMRWEAIYRAASVAPEEAHYLLALAMRVGATFASFPDLRSVNIWVSLVEPAEGVAV